MRLSPIASIRNRYIGKPNSYGDVDPSKFPPSFRISRGPGYGLNTRTSGLRFRGSRGQLIF